MEKDLKVKIDVDSASAKEKVEVFSDVLSNLQTGFSASKDLAEVFGIETGRLSKIIDNLTKIQTAQNSIQKISNLLAKDSAGTAKNGSDANEKLSGSLVGATGSFKVLNKVMSANVIGIIITAVATLASYWDKIKDSISGVSSEQKENLKTGTKLYDNAQKTFTSLEGQENIERQKGKSERAILKTKIEQLGVVISTGKADIENQEKVLAAQIEAETRNKRILKSVLEFVLVGLSPVLAAADKIASLFGKELNLREKLADFAASQFFNPEEVEKKGQEAINASKEKLLEFENQKAGFELSLKNIDSESAKSKAKQDNDYEKLRLANMEEGRKKELAEEELKYAEEKERYKDNTKALEELEKLHKKRVSEINKEWDAKEQKEREDRHKAVLEANDRWVKRNEESKRKSLENEFKLLEKSLKDKEITEEEALIRKQSLTQDFYEQQKADLQTHYDELLATELEKKANNQLSIEEYEAIEKALQAQKVEDEAALKIQQQAAEKELDTAIDDEKNARLIAQIEREKAITKAKWEFAEKAAKDGLGVIDTVNKNLIKNAKTQNDIEKAITLVKIGIDSAKAISSAIANANAPTPDNVATGGIAGIAKFAAISAQIASAVAQAHKVLSSGGNIGGGGGAPSTPSISAPQISAPQIGTTQIIARQHSPEPLKVFVTEADIRSAQQKVKVIEDQSVVV
ncbi:MAG: hypothetical protein ACO1PI_02465 [Bacteroidota bacterium]